MKHTFLIIFMCMAVCICVMLSLYATSDMSGEIHRSSFTRIIDNNTLIKSNTLDLKVNSYYLAGMSKEHIYFGNYTSPFHLLITNYSLTDSQHVSLKIALDSVLSPRTFRLTVDSPFFYLSHGQMPEYLRGNLGEWKADRYIENDLDYFVESLPIGANSIVVRSIPINSGEYELAKIIRGSGMTFKKDLLQKQVDGLFCLEGSLRLDKASNTIVYVHTYRNEVMVADSNLNLLYRTSTIDPFTRAPIKVSTAENESTLATPPAEINGYSAVFNNILYVQSYLMSKNESEDDYRDNTVIDVYDLTKRAYLKSFYLENINNHIVTSFGVFNGCLVALIDNYVVIYKISAH